MTALLASLFVGLILISGASLFAAVEWFEPNRRLALICKCALLAAAGAAIASQLMS
jgi:hypothetical protein